MRLCPSGRAVANGDAERDTHQGRLKDPEKTLLTRVVLYGHDRLALPEPGLLTCNRLNRPQFLEHSVGGQSCEAPRHRKVTAFRPEL